MVVVVTVAMCLSSYHLIKPENLLIGFTFNRRFVVVKSGKFVSDMVFGISSNFAINLCFH